MEGVGRPSKFEDPETLKKLEEAFLLGCTDAEACFFANVSPAALYEYQKRNPEYLERKEVLKQNPYFLARQSVIGGFSNPELALKYLERKKKDEFSLRSEITGENGKAINILLSPDIAEKHDLNTIAKNNSQG